jgi:hypothetical protein
MKCGHLLIFATIAVAGLGRDMAAAQQWRAVTKMKQIDGRYFTLVVDEHDGKQLVNIVISKIDDGIAIRRSELKVTILNANGKTLEIIPMDKGEIFSSTGMAGAISVNAMFILKDAKIQEVASAKIEFLGKPITLEPK